MKKLIITLALLAGIGIMVKADYRIIKTAPYPTLAQESSTTK